MRPGCLQFTSFIGVFGYSNDPPLVLVSEFPLPASSSSRFQQRHAPVCGVCLCELWLFSFREVGFSKLGSLAFPNLSCPDVSLSEAHFDDTHLWQDHRCTPKVSGVQQLGCMLGKGHAADTIPLVYRSLRGLRPEWRPKLHGYLCIEIIWSAPAAL